MHLNLLDLFRAPATSSSMLVNQGAIKFAFTYTKGANFWTREARDALQRDAESLAPYFIITKPVTLTYNVTGESDDDGSLASASSNVLSEDPGFWPSVVQNKVLTGVDANGDEADGEISWNWFDPWALGDEVGKDEYDFTSVVRHELVHSFGFSSGVLAAGNNDTRDWKIFSSYISDSHGNRAISSDYTWNTDFDANLTGGDGGLYFSGPHAVAAYGKLVPLYTPEPFAQGSSISHLDDATFTGANEQLMNSATNSGPSKRDLSPIEIGILSDLGYTMNPQAPTSALALVGFIFLRRIRRRSSTASL